MPLAVQGEAARDYSLPGHLMAKTTPLPSSAIKSTIPLRMAG